MLDCTTANNTLQFPKLIPSKKESSSLINHKGETKKYPTPCNAGRSSPPPLLTQKFSHPLIKQGQFPMLPLPEQTLDILSEKKMSAKDKMLKNAVSYLMSKQNKTPDQVILDMQIIKLYRNSDFAHSSKLFWNDCLNSCFTNQIEPNLSSSCGAWTPACSPILGTESTFNWQEFKIILDGHINKHLPPNATPEDLLPVFTTCLLLAFETLNPNEINKLKRVINSDVGYLSEEALLQGLFYCAFKTIEEDAKKGALL
jgi:hypothetical protein